jgi:hypothetical protein
MPSSIFSTYSTGENRITASTLAVLRSLSLGRIERLLGALLEQSDFELVRFENQINKDGKGIPDAEIVSSCRILVETKRIPNAVDLPQLQWHLKKLTNDPNQVLLVLTPDQVRPGEVDQLKDERATWASFSMLDQAIEELLADKREVTSERESFLLRELQTMFLEEGLIGSAKDVLVVPARRAWGQYQDSHAYVCQPNRSFQPVKRMAFYCFGQIQPLIPCVLNTWPAVLFERGKETGWLGELIDRLSERGEKEEGVSYKVMQLSGPDDPNTLKLPAPIVNDLKSDAGRPIAFTQNQRYITLEKVKSAKYTSELVAL